MSQATFELAAGLGCLFAALTAMLLAIDAGSRHRKQVARSLTSLGSVALGAGTRGAIEGATFTQRVVVPSLHRLAALSRRLSPVGYLDGLRSRLDKAGNPAGWDVERFLAGKALLGIVGASLGLIVPALLGKTLTAIVAAAGVGALGFFVPDLLLQQKRDTRQAEIRKSLADAMDMLTISVEAGLSFDAALAQVSQKTRGPLADELSRTLREMQLTSTRMEALRALSDRVDVPDLRAFVTAMVQADAFGIPIANVLRVQAKELRVRRRQNAEERAQKVPIKLVFPLVLCIMPALMIVIVGPAVIQISHTLLHGSHGFLGSRP